MRPVEKHILQWGLLFTCEPSLNALKTAKISVIWMKYFEITSFLLQIGWKITQYIFFYTKTMVYGNRDKKLLFKMGFPSGMQILA